VDWWEGLFLGYVLKPSMMIRCCGMLILVDLIIENLFDDAMQAATPGNSLISGVVRDWFMKLLENGADPPKPTERGGGRIPEGRGRRAPGPQPDSCQITGGMGRTGQSVGPFTPVSAENHSTDFSAANKGSGNFFHNEKKSVN